ncbi:MAG: hypothetical protein ACWGIK_13995 [Achromobacter pulmonis]|uniref:Uncharacterized protein n=1 Tax=Achromobacter pulmonis TaxID=1389932 RepID=A0A6S7DMG2_9BURK|nr:hypothetical protein [Achromobacter pulmonis]MCF7766132.1 hypothetical protein [Achromobacter pulmonis]MPT25830.1 hypothetical protein [Achromobacter sp.]CAB3862104.1 hypothetical protein LMG26788_02323 [Achromobacter pulmonis]
MALFPAPQPHAQRFELLCGASRPLRLRAGATVVCVSGSLVVAEPPYRSELPHGRYLAPPARLHAGESHYLAERASVILTALVRAEVICLQPPGAIARILAFAARLPGLADKNNGPGGVGALHKISK